MPDIHNDDTLNEEPLDPKVEAIRQKMVRLLMVSGGIMLLGFMAVFIAIVYKINTNKPQIPTIAQTPTIAMENTLTIPEGAHVISATSSDNHITLTLKQEDGAIRIQMHELDGTLLHGYSLKSKPQ